MNNNTLKEDDRLVSNLKEFIKTDNEERRIKRLTLEGGELEEQIIECGRCGNRGINKVIASHPQKLEEYVGGKEVCVEYAHIYLLECPVCSQMTLISYDWNTCQIDEYGDTYLNKEILYPKSLSSFPNTPKHIVELYESARKTMHIDNGISLMTLRKVLELICRECGSKRRTLESMLKDLVGRGIMPETLDKCGLLIRKLGNAGAHNGDDDFYVSSRDLEELIEFIGTIMYYFFELPVKVSRLNDRYL